MIPSWPSDLPRPMRDSWQAQNADPRRRRAPEAGPPGYGRRFSAVARRLALTIKVDRTGKQVFDRFHDVTLRHGTQAFWMPDPVTEGWPLIAPTGEALLDPTGAPLLCAAKLRCLFGEEPPVEGPLQGVTFTLSFTVTVLP